MKLKFHVEEKGGTGSGHHGHSGRPGKQGGSMPGSGGGGGKNPWDIGYGKDAQTAESMYREGFKPKGAKVGKYTMETARRANPGVISQFGTYTETNGMTHSVRISYRASVPGKFVPNNKKYEVEYSRKSGGGSGINNFSIISKAWKFIEDL